MKKCCPIYTIVKFALGCDPVGYENKNSRLFTVIQSWGMLMKEKLYTK